MKKRDYDLVKDGKFNRLAIMQRAWIYVRQRRYSLSAALKSSWADAKVKMEEIAAEAKFMARIAATANTPASATTNSDDSTAYGYGRGEHYSSFSGWGNYCGD